MKTHPRFTLADAERAHDEWGANCGPGAIAAIMGMTLDEVRPFMATVDFEAKRYTSPSMMWKILRAIGQPTRKLPTTDWPQWGLVRIQWEGPWTRPGVPEKARYRHTHWIGCKAVDLCAGRAFGIFDINCINNGSGWCSFDDWRNILVPWLLEDCEPKATGSWYKTHVIEVEPNAAMAAA